ncbi:hypothetical protein DF186_16270, partial [Enterococcus hirae]
ALALGILLGAVAAGDLQIAAVQLGHLERVGVGGGAAGESQGSRECGADSGGQIFVVVTFAHVIFLLLQGHPPKTPPMPGGLKLPTLHMDP